MTLIETEHRRREATGARPASSAQQAAQPRGFRGLTVASPAIAALVAYWLSELLPNSDPELGPTIYSKVLLGVLGIAILFAVAAWALSRFRPKAEHGGPLFAAAVSMLAVWDLATTKFALLPMPYFPGPGLVLEGLLEDRADLLESTFYSFRLMLCGYAAGVLVGLTSGVLMGWFRQVRYWGLPLMKFVGPIPATAFIPFVMVIFDEAFFSGAALIALAVWFPVTMLTMSGIANVPASYFDVAKTLGARRGFLVFRVAIPAAMPNVFIGLFMGMGAAFSHIDRRRNRRRQSGPRLLLQAAQREFRIRQSLCLALDHGGLLFRLHDAAVQGP